MSVKLIRKDGQSVNFAITETIAEDLKNAEMIVLQPEGDGKKENAFLDSLVKANTLIALPPVEIKVIPNSNVCTARISKRAKKIYEKMLAAWAVKQIVKNEDHVNSKLDDMISLLKGTANA